VARDIDAADECAAGGGQDETGQDLEERGLTGAVRAQNPEDLPGARFQAQPGQA